MATSSSLLSSRALRLPTCATYGDTVHQKVAGPVACVIASVTEKGTPALLAAGSDDAVKAGFHAGNVIKQIAGLVDGRGGGRPNMAQAGGKNAAGIADALAAAKTALGA